MNWLKLVQAILSLSPEVIGLVQTVVTAVAAAPKEHQDAVVQQAVAVAEKHLSN